MTFILRVGSHQLVLPDPALQDEDVFKLGTQRNITMGQTVRRVGSVLIKQHKYTFQCMVCSTITATMSDVIDFLLVTAGSKYSIVRGTAFSYVGYVINLPLDIDYDEKIFSFTLITEEAT